MENYKETINGLPLGVELEVIKKLQHIEELEREGLCEDITKLAWEKALAYSVEAEVQAIINKLNI